MAHPECPQKCRFPVAGLSQLGKIADYNRIAELIRQIIRHIFGSSINIPAFTDQAFPTGPIIDQVVGVDLPGDSLV